MNRYFYIDTEGKQKGTFSPEELKQEEIRKETLVWTQGMEQWMRAIEVDELKQLFGGEAPIAVQEQSYESSKRPDVMQSHTSSPVSQMPKSWLIESILVTLLPFLLCGSFLSLLGIIAVVHATQVESFFNRGDYSASIEASRSAAKWTRIAMWIAIGWIAFIILVVVLLLVSLGSLANIEELLM